MYHDKVYHDQVYHDKVYHDKVYHGKVYHGKVYHGKVSQGGRRGSLGWLRNPALRFSNRHRDFQTDTGISQANFIILKSSESGRLSV